MAFICVPVLILSADRMVGCKSSDVNLNSQSMCNSCSPLQSVILFDFADTQEAPKSLSLDSSSSLESLTSLDGDDDDGMRARSPPLLTSSMLIPPPPLPFVSPRPAPPPLLLPGHRTSGGAFTSYVRRRGEPDGRTACAGETGGSGVASNKTVGGGCGNATAPTVGKVQYCDTLIHIVRRKCWKHWNTQLGQGVLTVHSRLSLLVHTQ